MADQTPNLDLSQFGGTPDLDLSQFQPAAAPERTALGEIGTGFARGALVDLPTLLGQASQFVSPTGSGINQFGQGMVQSAAARGQQASLTLNPAAHGGVVNALASGAEAVPSVAAPLAIGGLAALAAPEALAGGALAAGVGAVSGGALFGAQAGQQTLEKAQAKGLSPEAAQTASRLNAASTFATQVGLGLVGGKVLGVAGTALGRVIGTEGAPLAGDILNGLTGQGGIIAPTLKAAAGGAIEGVGLGAVQSATSAAIENAYGVDNTDPLEAAKDSIVPMLGLTAALTPFGLAGRALAARAAGNRTAILAHPETDPAERAQLADQYAAALAKPGTPEAQEAAANFRANAQTAIDNKQALPVNSQLFDANTIQPPTQPEAPLALTNNPSPNIVFPDGTVARNQKEVDDYINGLPEDQQGPARAKLMGLGPQPVTPEAAPPEPAPALLPYNAPPEAVDQMVANSNGLIKKADDVYTFPDGSTTKDVNDVQDFFTRQQAEQGNQPEALQLLHNPTPPEVDQMVATSDGLVQKKGSEYTFPDGSSTTDIKQVQTFFAEKAERDAARAADPNASKTTEDITNDLASVNKTITGEDTLKAQQRVPVMKQLDAIGIDKLDTHDAQIEALQARLADPDVKIGTPTRDRLTALLKGWQDDRAAAGKQPEIGPETITAKNGEKYTLNWDDDKGEVTAKDSAGKTVGTLGTEFQRGSSQPAFASDVRVDSTLRRNGIATALYDRFSREFNGNVTQSGVQTPAGRAIGDAIGLPRFPGATPDGITDISTGVRNPNASLGENMPVTADVATTQPAQAEPLGENVTQSPQSHAQDTANMVDATLASFNDRVRSGEQLTPLEQERMEDLQGFRNSLAEVTSGDNTNDAYAQSISDMAREAATAPYKESYRRYEVGNPEALDPGIMLDSLRTGKLADTLATIAQQGSTPEVKALAQRISALVPDTTLKYTRADGTGAVGEFDPTANHVNIFPGGESEQTILHESVHAAQQAAVARAEAITTPRTQDEAKLKNAYNEIESIRSDVIKAVGPDAAYGLTNAHEFLAELNTNPEFQQVLKDASAPGKQSLWTRAVNAVKGLLGLKTDGGDYLARAMAANEAFFGEPGPDKAGFPLPTNSTEDRLFRKSPKDAAEVTDRNYSKMTGLIDKVRDANYGALNLQVYKASLGWKTVQFIADRLRAMPEMVQSGFAKGVDAYQAAHEARRVAMNVIEHPVAAYADGVRKMLTGLGDSDKARDLSRQMMTIGGEASRGGFDYRMNYADNVKAGRDLPAANKAYVDDIHRQFTQLQRTNPEAAKAIENGELQQGRTNILKTATVMRNLINVSGEAAMTTHAKALDLMDPTLKTARNSDTAKFADGMASTLHARLQQAFADARTALPEGSVLRDQINEMSDLYNAQAQNPYFSLGRQGDYFVKVGFRNMDAATQQKLQDALRGTNKVLGNLTGGESHAFFRVDTQDQANGLYNKLLAAGGDRIDPATGAWGKLADRVDSAFGVSPALRSILASLHESVERSGLSGEAAATMRDTITRELLSMLPETSSRNALMQRRGIPGYDADFLGNFARRAMGGVQDTSNIHSQPAFTAARKQMSDAIDGLNRTGSADGRVRAQMAADEINKRFANSQKPIDNKAINLINSLGHTFYLAASPAYLIRTTAQPFHRGLPIVGARFGFTRGAQEIGKATGVALKVMANTIADGYSENGLRGVLDANMSFRNLGLPANEQAFIQELHDRGTLNLGQARQLQSMAMGGTQRQQDLARMASMTAQYAEMTNRLAVGLAAFRLSERSNPTGDAAKTQANTDYAVQTIDRAMDNFDPSNTARQISKNGFAGKTTPLLTAFMNYNLQTMQQIARTVHDGLFNRDPSVEGLQRAKEARREFAGLMATTAMISGGLGLPFANVFAGVYNTLTNDNNDPSDIRVDAQNALDRLFGHTVGGVIAHGLPHAVGFDSSTFGLENLLPGSEFLSSRQLLKDRLDGQSQALMGPALNAGVGVALAMDKMSDGYYVKGIEAALPSGLKPYFKAVELGTSGYTDSKENPQAINPVTPENPHGNKATWGQIGLQALGFRSARAADVSEAQQFATARQNRLDYQRGLIEDQFYKGALSGDQGTLDNATRGLQQFNTANPTQPIREVRDAIRQRMVGLALAGITGTGVNATSPRQALTLGQQLLFATDNENRAMP